MLLLAFDTATDVATSALVDDGRVLGERTSVPRIVGGRRRASETQMPHLPTSTRSSWAPVREVLRARGSASRSRRVSGSRSSCRSPASRPCRRLRVRRKASTRSSTLAAARSSPGPRVLAPADLELEPGTTVVGSGAVRYRATLEDKGAHVPADDDEIHHPTRACMRLSRASSSRRGGRAPVRPLTRCEGPEPGVNLELRRLEQRDLDTVEVIERASYPTPWSRSMFAAELRKPSALALGAYLDTGELVGYAFVSRYVDAWHVMNVAVAPEFRRRGIATALLARLFDITADDRRGYTLEVRVSNTDAIQLYEQLGFEARGIRRGYYTDNREDALIMWRAALGLLCQDREPRFPDGPLLHRCEPLEPAWAPAGRSRLRPRSRRPAADEVASS